MCEKCDISTDKLEFDCAQNALKDNTNLEKVIIMEHAPRYDTADVDPVGLKPALAKYANNTFNQLWLNCPLKNKISIGHHRIDAEKSSPNHANVFRNVKTSKYDGVHFYGVSGQNIYSKSVLEIMKNVMPVANQSQYSKAPQNTLQQPQQEREDDHQHCKQAQFQKNKKKSTKKTKYHPSVQVKNRFNVFNSNSGNQ